MKKVFNDKTKVYWIYTLLFFLIACIVFSTFILNKRSFIWQTDGLKQHYIILRDFNQNVREFLKNPGNGVDLFSWNMGLGLDVIGQYSYYVLGDPFAYLSLLFPMECLEYTYTFLILLRIYCAGLAFIFYCKHHKSKKEIPHHNALIAAIIYAFCSFSLLAGIKHPYFLNPLIFFPLLLWGVDKLLDENKKVPLTALVAITAIANYYFFYMLTILAFIYAIIRYICEYRQEGIKHFFKKLGGAILCYIIGILIASIILLPTVYAFLNSPRSGEEMACQYEAEYYRNLFTVNLLTSYDNNWSMIGISSIILLMLPILWSRRKKHPVYFNYWIVTTILLLLPFAGSMLNGFSFPNNRWVFAYVFILAYIVAICFDEQYTKKELRNMVIFFILYGIGGTLLARKGNSNHAFIIYVIQVAIAFLMMLIIIGRNRINSEKLKKISKWAIYLLVIMNISATAYGLYTSYDRGFAKEFIKLGESEKTLVTQYGKNKDYKKNIQDIIQEDSSFYRIAKAPHQVQNLSTYYRYPSTECFLSIGNRYVYELSKELADNTYNTIFCIRGLADRSRVTTLLGTKYYVVDNKNQNSIPYGYSLKEENDGVYTYQNNYSLPIGVCYTEYLSREEYEKLTPIEKEKALLKAAVVEKEDIKNVDIKEKKNIEDIKNSYKVIESQVIDKEHILQNNGENKKVVIEKKNQRILFDIPKVENSELYVFISGFEYQGNSKHTVTAKYQGKSVEKFIDNKTTSAYYQKAPEILLNLGYYEQTEGKIELLFSSTGTYELKDIQILAVPMDSYEQKIQNLQQNELKEVKCTNREISGKLDLSQDAILQIASSYTSGWKAYIDGNKVDTIRVNTAFIGIPVEAGEHEVILQYETPYLKLGIVCSGIGVIAYIVLVIYEKKKIKKESLS